VRPSLTLLGEAGSFAQSKLPALKHFGTCRPRATVRLAPIKIRKLATEARGRTQIGIDRRFQFPFLPPRRYPLSVQTQGSKQCRDPEIAVAGAEAGKATVRLEFRGVSESVAESVSIHSNLAGGTSPYLPENQRATSRFFDSAAFVAASACQFGDLGCNAIPGPNAVDFDATFRRDRRISERVRVQSQVTGSNALSISKYNNLGRYQDEPAIGQALSRLGQYPSQFDAKVRF
jgi:hypothetical protein